MLHEFLVENREEIIDRARAKIAQRAAPRPTEAEFVNGVPLFLDQLTHTLRLSLASSAEIGQSATRHGNDLLRMGFTVAQVVHDYGNVCQAVTELAAELAAPISNDEFHTFNRCLDDAIAEAVTEYSRQREHSIADEGTERLGFLAHELRNMLTRAMLAFEALKTGSVGTGGSTSAILGRSLLGLRDLIDRSLAEVRLEAGIQRRERVLLAEFIEEVEVTATMEAMSRGLHLSVSPVEFGVAVEGDRQILAAAVANLLHNAFKFTRAHGHVSLKIHTTPERVLIEIEDECGGLPPGKAEELFRPFAQRGADHSGVGLGLTISRRGVEANGGEIHVRNLPGQGCVFTVDLPRQPS